MILCFFIFVLLLLKIRLRFIRLISFSSFMIIFLFNCDLSIFSIFWIGIKKKIFYS